MCNANRSNSFVPLFNDQPGELSRDSAMMLSISISVQFLLP